MRLNRAVKYTWADPTVPLIVPSGGRAIVDVRTADGSRPFGFMVQPSADGEVLTVRWPGLLCIGDDLTRSQVPVPPPAGPLTVNVLT